MKFYQIVKLVMILHILARNLHTNRDTLAGLEIREHHLKIMILYKKACTCIMLKGNYKK
jgi:hypothetical protein